MPASKAFILVPGAGGSAWYWHRVAPRLEKGGHEAVPVSLPAADDTAGLPGYAAAVLIAKDDRFLAADFQRRIARDRLGISADEMPGGHLVALRQPEQLAGRLESYATSAAPSSDGGIRARSTNEEARTSCLVAPT